MAPTPSSPKLQQIPPTEISRNPENPRLVFRQDEMESLLVSIAQHGIQVPLTVYKEGGHYRLLDGERRWRCAMKLNLKAVPALVQDKPTELQNLVLMYNIHALREQWDYFTIASKLARVIILYKVEQKARPTEGQLSELTGLTRGQIRRCKLLLDLPEKFKTMLMTELELPKAKQKISEDLFIEMERALKTVTRRVPEYEPRLDSIRNVLVKKFRAGTIPAVTDFRQLGKIATAVDKFGVAQSKAKKALDRIFSAESDEGIRQVYSQTVEFAYDEERAAKHVTQLITYLSTALEDGSASEFDDAFLEQLRALMQQLRRLQKAIG